MQKYLLLSALLLLCVTSVHAEEIDNSIMGFTASFPENWVGRQKTSMHYVIKDTSKTYPAMIGVTVRAIDSLVYATEKEWVYAASESYQISVENDAFFGYVFVNDSLQHNNAFSIYMNTWYGIPVLAEHIRFIGIDGKGYELYILSDTVDMQTNWSVYSAIVDSIKPEGCSDVRIGKPFADRNRLMIRREYDRNMPTELFTLSGRQVRVPIRNGVQYRGYDFSTTVYISRKQYGKSATGILLR